MTEHNLKFLSLKRGRTGLLSLHLSKCHIVMVVGNHMSWLTYYVYDTLFFLSTIFSHISTHALIRLVEPGVVPNCLQRLSVDGKSHC